MRETYWGYWIILLGIFVIVIMMLVSNLTTTSTQDYYLVKEVTEAAMVDAVDLAYYRQSGELKINREKFVESFIRRFAENVSLNTYQVDFYDLYEAPPKVSVKVSTKTSSFTVAADNTTFDIVTEVNAILELDGTASYGGPATDISDEFITETSNPSNSSSGGSSSGSGSSSGTTTGNGGNSSGNNSGNNSGSGTGSGSGSGSGNTGGSGSGSGSSGGDYEADPTCENTNVTIDSASLLNYLTSHTGEFYNTANGIHVKKSDINETLNVLNDYIYSDQSIMNSANFYCEYQYATEIFMDFYNNLPSSY